MTRDQVYAATLDKYLKPVEAYRRDPQISEIMINGAAEVYVERAGKLELTPVKFRDEDTLMAVANNLAQYVSKRLTPLTARFDSRLPDGSRVHVVTPRCSRRGLCISIRKFSPLGFSLEGLVESGSITPEAREYLELMVRLEQNFIVSGGTGSGKTSFLNALSLKIPPQARIVVLEDTSELQLRQPHVLQFETADPDRHGAGAVTIRDLFHSALRMRPDRIVIGECRGGEALDLIQAMTSGHGGSMSTLHANTASDALHRLETMALMSKLEIPLQALRAQIVSAIDVVVQLSRLDDGTRVVAEITETMGLNADASYKLNPVFEQVDVRRSAGGTAVRLRRTGNLSRFAALVAAKGLKNQINLTGPLFNQAQGS